MRDFSKMKFEDLIEKRSELKVKYDGIETECAKKGMAYEDFQKEAQEVKEALYLITKYIRLKQDPIVEYGKEWNGELMTFDEFKNKSKSGELKDGSGYGYYATQSSKSDVLVVPSDVLENIIRNDFSHVIWFSNEI